MSDFVWKEEFTEYAIRNLKHSTWAYVNPPDILKTIEWIQQVGGNVTSDEFVQRHKTVEIKHEDYRQISIHLGLLTKSSGGSLHLTDRLSRLGFYSGKELAASIEDCGIDNPVNLNILGHNFTLYVRESLPFCCKLMRPGVPKDYLETVLADHYVFNQKLNQFKFDNLLRILKELDVIEETEKGFVVKHAPPALTFYYIASEYFFLALNNVDVKIKADDLLREVHYLIPNRKEDFTVLGFERFPIEGWGENQAWMTPKSFEQLLHIGLIDPLCIARILQTIVRDKKNPSQDLAHSTLRQLGKRILDHVEGFRGEPINLPEVLREYEVPD
jgi:hypothetical protein|tara:strand:- start:5382 stop:6368 length:987 start_codon:yes stop_codon:yes gene_type:complete